MFPQVRTSSYWLGKGFREQPVSHPCLEWRGVRRWAHCNPMCLREHRPAVLEGCQGCQASGWERICLAAKPVSESHRF